MPEDRNLKERLVTGFERDGKRRRFDPQAKRELVQACLQPGVSVARIALEHGLNANLLRKWISDHKKEARRDDVARTDVAQTVPAFVPVVPISRAATVAYEAAPTACAQAQLAARAPQPSQLVVELPNGVMLRLECAGHVTTLVTAMIETLGRCDVPVRR